MRRLVSMIAVATVALVMAAPAAALHEDDQNGLTPVIPFQHAGDPAFYLVEGESLDVGTRWGACTRGLAQSFIKSANVEFEVVNIDGGNLPSYTLGSWSEPVNPPDDVIGVPISDFCSQPSVSDTGWWTFWVSTITFNDSGVFEVSVDLSVNRAITDGQGLFQGIDAAGTITVVVLTALENPSVFADLSCDASNQPVLTITNDGNVTVLAQIEDDPILVSDTLAPGESLSYPVVPGVEPRYDVGDIYTWQAEYPIGPAILDFESGEVEACV